MTVNTFTRPGYADIKLFGLLFSVSNFHIHRRDLRWTTGVSADIGPWKSEPHRSWFVEASLLGFSIGICR